MGKKKEVPKVIYEGWMVRYGRRKLGRSFIHMRYFVLESRLLAYYKKKPKDNMLPLKTLHIDGSCRVEDRGLKPHHGHMVYVLCIYNKKESYNRITRNGPNSCCSVNLFKGWKMAAFNIQEALAWKEKIELVIDQQQDPSISDGNKAFASYKSTVGHQRNVSFDDHDSLCSQDEDEEGQQILLQRRKTIGNGPPDSVPDWTQELELGLSNPDNSVRASSKKHWRLVRCQNGLRIFEELLEVDQLPRSCSKAMKAVGVVDATCEAIFEILVSMDATRFEWDCTFQYGSLVEEVDGHTAILYHKLHLDWMPKFVWPRDLCYVRYWRRNDDGSYVVLFRSREHADCGPQPGCVRAHIESGGFEICPLRSWSGRPRTQVQHLMQIDMKGWVAGYFPSFQQYSLLQMLNSVAGLREWFAQTDETHTNTGIPVMFNMTSDSVSPKKDQKTQESNMQPTPSLDQLHSASKHSVMFDEETDEDEDHITEHELETCSAKPETDNKQTVSDEEASHDVIDLSCFSGTLRCDDNDNARNSWKLADGNNFKVRGKNFVSDKSKVPAGKPIMELVAVDWLKDSKRMDHVARRPGSAVQVASEKGLFSLAINLQVPGSTCYSLVFYFVVKTLAPGSLLQRFFDGDDEFRNSRFKLIPSVPKGSWIVRQSVGSSACLLAKAVDCTFIRGPKYLEIDVDIGSSTVANGVLGLVLGVVTTLVVDLAFLIQGNTPDELPEQLIGAVRISHVELSSAAVPEFDSNPSSE